MSVVVPLRHSMSLSVQQVVCTVTVQASILVFVSILSLHLQNMSLHVTGHTRTSDPVLWRCRTW